MFNFLIMKLLPYFFKWTGLTLFIIGFIFGFIDDGRHSFMEGYMEARNEPVEYEFVQIMPDIVSTLADYATLIGLLIYILAKNKIEDELAQKLRYEAAYIVLVFSILVILIWYIFMPNLQLHPSSFIGVQMVFYLILRLVKKREILGLEEAMNFFKLKKGTIITLEQEETIKENGKTINIIPAWKWLLKNTP